MERMDAKQAEEWSIKLESPLPGQFDANDDDWTSGATVITEGSTIY